MHTRTHARTHVRTHARTHAKTRTLIYAHCFCNPIWHFVVRLVLRRAGRGRDRYVPNSLRPIWAPDVTVVRICTTRLPVGGAVPRGHTSGAGNIRPGVVGGGAGEGGGGYLPRAVWWQAVGAGGRARDEGWSGGGVRRAVVGRERGGKRAAVSSHYPPVITAFQRPENACNYRQTVRSEEGGECRLRRHLIQYMSDTDECSILLHLQWGRPCLD